MRRPACTIAPHERDVFLLDLAVVELAGELLVRRVVLGDDHQSRRAAIEPVHDARPLLAADAAQIVDMVEQRVDQRAARVAGRRVHDHAGRLVDDDEVGVLIEDRAAAAPQAAASGRQARGRRRRSVCPVFTGWFGLGAACRRRGRARP